MDFNKYNKGLRFYATLLNLNPDIFNTEMFIDIYVKYDTVYIYYITLNDIYIIDILTSNKYYYNTIYKDGRIIYCYKLENKEDISVLKDIKYTGSLFLTDIFYVKMCILWKKYLDSSFLNCLNINTCKQCKEEG